MASSLTFRARDLCGPFQLIGTQVCKGPRGDGSSEQPEQLKAENLPLKKKKKDMGLSPIYLAISLQRSSLKLAKD